MMVVVGMGWERGVKLVFKLGGENPVDQQLLVQPSLQIVIVILIFIILIFFILIFLISLITGLVIITIISNHRPFEMAQ